MDLRSLMLRSTQPVLARLLGTVIHFPLCFLRIPVCHWENSWGSRDLKVCLYPVSIGDTKISTVFYFLVLYKESEIIDYYIIHNCSVIKS